MRQVIAVAKIAERLTATLGSAIITDRGSTVSASGNSRLAAANYVPRTKFEFNLTGWMHLPEMVAKERTKGGRKYHKLLRSTSPRKRGIEFMHGFTEHVPATH